MEFRVDITKNLFPEGPAAMRRAIGAGFASAGAQVLTDMQRRTPVDTGGLRGSETMTASETQLRLYAGTDHALFVHQGTRHMGARPFMREAVEAGLSTVAQAIATAAERELA